MEKKKVLQAEGKQTLEEKGTAGRRTLKLYIWANIKEYGCSKTIMPYCVHNACISKTIALRMAGGKKTEIVASFLYCLNMFKY